MARVLGVLQANLNHARGAQDLFVHALRERDCSVGMVAEPYFPPRGPLPPNWARSADGSAAIHWRPAAGSPPCRLAEAGVGYVAVWWGPILLIEVYISPNVPDVEARGTIGCVEDCVRRHSPTQLIVAGDFNAKHGMWGSPRPNPRGADVERWAVALDLSLINEGSMGTCVRPWGESIVDLTWASRRVAQRIRDWRVVDEGETLSDHLYIQWSVSPDPPSRRVPGRCRNTARRWVLTKLDPDRMTAALLASTWGETPEPVGRDGLQKEAERLVGVVASACDAAMPRSRPCAIRAAYWWTEEIAELRRSSVRARRRIKAARALLEVQECGLRQGRLPYTRVTCDAARRSLMLVVSAYRMARERLRAAVAKAKARAWQELLDSVEGDPWGRPYRMVMGKLRPWAPPVTESLPPEVVDQTLGALFPGSGEHSESPQLLAPPLGEVVWSDDLEVTESELAGVVRRLGAKGKAPGPDGIPGRVWALAMDHLSGQVRHLFTRCLKEGVFPQVWRRARLVLLQKEGKQAGTPSAYRPICLLDEAGKMLERIVSDRLVRHLSRVGPDLHGNQYGFRPGRSTLDAIDRVRAYREAAVEEGGVAMGVSLDISNAFNTLPWHRIGEAIELHEVPPYLHLVLRDYFRDREIAYNIQGGLPCRRRVVCGVPQGSVLGPLMWDLAYDTVLRLALPPGCTSICYADDTLVLARGRTWGDTAVAAEAAVASVTRAIGGMGLRVAPSKTEILFLHAGGRGEPPRTPIKVGDFRVPAGPTIKYLGLVLDGKWSFGPHFSGLVPRVARVANALARLMPRVAGPDGGVRRLYMAVVCSIALYGAPIWARQLAESPGLRSHRAKLRGAMRSLATRAIRAYRTVSAVAAHALAGLPPLELLATERARVYWRARQLREEGGGVALTPRAMEALRLQARQRTIQEWSEFLLDPRNTPGGPARRTVGAVQPCLQLWADRRGRGLSYRTTQVLTGHGCFGEYLCRIRRERVTDCHHCGEAEDTAQHTLQHCQAWGVQRRVLTDQIGPDLGLSSVVASMLESPQKWRAVVSFCEEVISRKETAENLRRPRPPRARLRDGGAWQLMPAPLDLD